MNDMQLLRNFREEDSQSAFAQIMNRHYNFVLGTCLRELGTRPLAEDAAQVVFLLLSRKAGTIREADTLVGWLFQTARWTCRDFRKQERRRLQSEQKVFSSMQTEPGGGAWGEIEPYVNDAVATLSALDREAVLLRFFEGMTLTHTGEVLGVSEGAAKMRISRALDKLRTYFSRHQIQLESSALATLLSVHVCTETGAAVIPSPSLHVLQLTEGIIKKMAMAKLRIAAAIVAVGGLSTVALSQSIHFGRSSHQVITLPGFPPSSRATGKFHLPHQTPGLAVLTGIVKLPDGKPASGITIVAQMQNSATIHLSSDQYGATWAEATTDKDGAYRLAGLIAVPYNVTVDPRSNGPWVTSAAQGVVARTGASGHVRDLILTHGSYVTGLVTDQNTGAPVAGAPIGCYGPETPDSSAMIQLTYTDNTGHYKLRAAPGKNRVYLAVDNTPDDATVMVADSGTSTANLHLDAVKLSAKLRATMVGVHGAP